MIARQSHLLGNYFRGTLLQNSVGWRGVSIESTKQRIPTKIRLRKAEKVRNGSVTWVGNGFQVQQKVEFVSFLYAVVIHGT